MFLRVLAGRMRRNALFTLCFVLFYLSSAHYQLVENISGTNGWVMAKTSRSVTLDIA